MTDQERAEELRRLIAKREGNSGYTKNVIALKAALVEVESRLAL